MNLDARSLQLLAAEYSCPGHLLLLEQIQALIDDYSDAIANAKTREEEERAVSDWKALRRVQTLLKRTPEVCHQELQQHPNPNPEMENLKIQRDPRGMYQYGQEQMTGFPTQPYRPPQVTPIQYPGNQPTTSLPPYFQKPA